MSKSIILDKDYQLSTGPNGAVNVQSRRNQGSFCDPEIFLRLPNIPTTTKDALRAVLSEAPSNKL